MIETQRLTLSPYSPGDADGLATAANHIEVARMMESIASPFTAADAHARIEQRPCDAVRFTFAIREKPTNRIIGEIAAGGGGGQNAPRLGYFFHPDSWGKGYATEALAAALAHAFEVLMWDVIEADTFDDNPASSHLLRKAGFTAIGPAGCQSLARLEASDTTLFRLKLADWGGMHRVDAT